MVCRCISMPITARYMAAVGLMPLPHCHNVSTASLAGYGLIAFNSKPIRWRWCGSCLLASCHNFSAVHSPSLALLFVPSRPFESSEFPPTIILKWPLTFRELCPTVSLHSTIFATSAATSPTTTSVPFRCRLCTRDTTMAILSWSGFQPTYGGISTLQLVWFSTMLLRPHHEHP